MTVFGCLWGLILLFCMLKKDIKYMFSFLVFSMVLQCNNVFIVNDIACGPQLLSSFFFIIKSFFYKTKKENNLSKIPLLFLFYILFQLFFFKTFDKCFLNFVQIITYLICFYRINMISYLIDKEFIKKIINKLCFFILIIGFFQFISELFNYNSLILRNFIYNDINNSNVYYNSLGNGKSRVYSVFMEPSYLGGLLVGLFFYYLNYTCINFKKLFIILVEIMLTFSSTAYGVFILMLILYLIKNKKSKFSILIVFMSIISFVVLYFGTDILKNVIFEKSLSASSMTRKIWNTSALNSFLSSKILGVGYKNVRASSFAYSLLGEFGLIGVTLYIIVFIKLLRNIIKFDNKKMSLSISYILLSLIFSQLIACPDLELCSFWIAMYFYSLSSNINFKEVYL